MSKSKSRTPVRLAAVLLFLLGVTALPAADPIPWELRAELTIPVRQLRAEIEKDKAKRTSASRDFVDAGDGVYQTTMHVDTADKTRVTTERILLSVSRADGKGRWQVTKQEVQDTVSVLRRGVGGNCYPFDKFSFDREGLKAEASGGWVCESYFEGQVNRVILRAPNTSFSYSPPAWANPEYPAIHEILLRENRDIMTFKPQSFGISCDAETCEQLLQEHFSGLERIPADQRTDVEPTPPAAMDAELRKDLEDQLKRRDSQRQENPFAHFIFPNPQGNHYFTIWIQRDDDHSFRLEYDNWEGDEIQVSVFQRTTDPLALNGMLYAYPSEKTARENDAYAIERREDRDRRWYEVESLTGEVDVALENPEVLKADVTFGLKLKRDAIAVPFSLAGFGGFGNQVDNRFLVVNSIQHDGKELTWVKLGELSGLVALPERTPAGTIVDLHVDFETKAIEKTNHAASVMSRFGWMPFVDFNDPIENFDLVVRTPAEYEVLSVGHRAEEAKHGSVLETRWVAQDVAGATIIFGKYNSDTARDYAAKKLDGTEVPIEVHVDEVSMSQLDTSRTIAAARDMRDAVASGARGIRGGTLRAVATQAAAAVNLYSELSGVDYPFDELNLVNDPGTFLMYGQAPSSMVFLGTMALRTDAGTGDANTSRFLKSLVAHEVGHQWWGSRITNANSRNYWFVETLAEFFSAIYVEQGHGRKDYDIHVEEWRRTVLDTDMMAATQNASTHFRGRFHQPAVYNKGPYMFHVLRQTFGDEKFFPALRQASEELAGKHVIVSRDIQQAFEKALGGTTPDGRAYNVDLEWFFDQWLRSAGVPQLRFNYDVRRTEDGSFLIEGVIDQRVVIGSRSKVREVPDRFYRGVVDVTALIKDQQLTSRVVVQGARTPVKLKVPERPVEVRINQAGSMLTHDIGVNVSSW